MAPHLHDRDPHDVAELERRIGRDVDTFDREGAVQADPPERAMGLIAEMAPRALVERQMERRGAVGAQAHEREAAPDVPAEHG